MREHRIPANTPVNRKAECYDCGGMFTPPKAKAFCVGRPVAEKKAKKR